MSNVEPIVFENRNGLKLFGVIHEPPVNNRKNVAILLLSPGIKMRVGPNLLYKIMTRCFVELGFTVVRYDFYGLGDSEGELTEEILPDVYNHIEVGRYVDDTIDGMDWVEENYGYKNFILSGLCGGAITGLLAASKDERVSGLLSLGITPVLASSAANTSAYMTQGQLEDMRKTYLGKLFNLKAWYRLLTFQSDYSVMWKILLMPYNKYKAIKSKKDKGSDAPNKEEIDDNSNPLFPPAFFNMLTNKRKHLLIFGGGDRLLWEFNEKFVSRYEHELQEHKDQYRVCVVENANHVLSYKSWQDKMLDYSREWLKDYYC